MTSAWKIIQKKKSWQRRRSPPPPSLISPAMYIWGRRQTESNSWSMPGCVLGLQIQIFHPPANWTKVLDHWTHWNNKLGKRRMEKGVYTRKNRVIWVPRFMNFSGSVSSLIPYELLSANASHTYCLSDFGLFVDTTTCSSVRYNCLEHGMIVKHHSNNQVLYTTNNIKSYPLSNKESWIKSDTKLANQTIVCPNIFVLLHIIHQPIINRGSDITEDSEW